MARLPNASTATTSRPTASSGRSTKDPTHAISAATAANGITAIGATSMARAAIGLSISGIGPDGRMVNVPAARRSPSRAILRVSASGIRSDSKCEVAEQ